MTRATWRSGGVVTMLALTTLPTLAHAQQVDPNSPQARFQRGIDGDLDLFRPTFAPEILPGLDVPANWRGGSVRVGLALQYSLNPLVLKEFDEEVGSVVHHRFSGYAGISVDIARSFTVRAVLPLYVQSGSTAPRYTADGFALGDVSVGAHWAFLRKPVFSMGISVDATFPTSRVNYYAGERTPKLLPSLMFMWDVGRVRVVSNLGSNIRFSGIDTLNDLSLGSELVFNNGVRVNIIREKLDIGATIYSRFGFANFFGAGESAGEFLVNFAYNATPWLTVDVGAGRGFTEGYGASDVRVWGQLRFQRKRPPEPVFDGEDVLADNDPDAGKKGLGFDVRVLTDLDGGDGGANAEEEWDEGEVAKVEKDQIKIRKALQFELGTARLLPESYGTLDYIADLLNDDARIGHVVIEGHASPDGPYDKNYTLSVDRARSIWERLVKQGVHPQRLSLRGMGEVMPVEDQGGADALGESRRVVFTITKQYEPEDDIRYDLDLKYPWNGEAYRATMPRIRTADELAREAMGEDIGPRAPNAPPPKERDNSLDDVSFDEEGPADGEAPADEDVDDADTPPPSDAPASPDADDATPEEAP